ncbi:TRAF-type zinc finger domain-containing protein 1 [Mantella aurantiaca]
MASSTEQETRLCGNCKRDIPEINFTIHEIHCHRNIRICKICKEPFPSSDMEEHMATEHVPVTCKCKMTMEKNLLEEHELSSCPLRLVKCQFCELELPCNKLGEHEEYCGARTERCEKCGFSVLTKDLKDHPAVCGTVTEPKKPARTQSYRDPDYEGAWFDSLRYRNTFTDDMFSRIPKHVPSRFYGNSVLTRSLKTSNEEAERNKRRQQNRENAREYGFDDIPAGHWAEEEEVLGALEEDAIGIPHGYDLFQPVTRQNNTGLSHEPETSISRRDPDFWRNMYSTDSVTRTTFRERNNVGNDDSVQLNERIASSSDVTQLPCEFCEELFPLEDLILHQSGCRLPARSNRRDSPSPTENVRSISPPVHGSQMVLLPCEFCGILLEGEILFHHQDQCEKCPDFGKSSPFTPALLPDDVTREETPYRTYEAPATLQSRHSSTTAKVNAGVDSNRYMSDDAARPPRPGRTTLLADNRYQQPRMNNTLLNPNLDDMRRRNMEENLGLFRNQQHDNLSARGTSNRNQGSRNKVTNKKINPEDVSKEE